MPVAANRLDVVILNDAPTALAFQILKSGKLASERDRIDGFGWALGGALLMSVLGTIGEWLVRAVF